MIVCQDPLLEKWTPDFSSSDRLNPSWTRVRYAGMELCNSLDWVDWSHNPIQVQLCDACGCSGCSPFGYVHVSRLKKFILWTTPQIEETDNWGVTRYAPLFAVTRLGAIAIPESVWASWRVVVRNLPEVISFPNANGRALAEGWVLGSGRPQALDQLVPMLKARLLACDTLEVPEAIQRIERWLVRLREMTTMQLGGDLRPLSETGLRIETLYFDGPSDEDWSALAVQGDNGFPLFDREHVFIPSGGDT